MTRSTNHPTENTAGIILNNNDTNSAYKPEIDGLRGYAIGLVVLYHAFPNIMPGGFIGVDIFFVISGYLITRQILHEFNAESFSIFNFWGRRIKRLFPSLLLVLAASLTIGYLVLFTDEYAQLNKHISGSTIFITNFLLAQEVGYFDIAASQKPLLHLWSLSVEEQFYIIWPVILVLALLLKTRTNLIIIAIVAASFATNLILEKQNPSENFFLPWGRFWEILAGALLATSTTKCSEFIIPFKISRDKLNEIATAVGFVFIFSGAILLSDTQSYPGYAALIPVSGAILVISGGSSGAKTARMLCANRAIIYLGLISYPLYLWHWPIFSFVAITENAAAGNTVNRIAALILSMLLAGLTYHLIEKKLKLRKPTKPLSLFLITLMAMLGFASLQLEALKPVTFSETLNEQSGYIGGPTFEYPFKNVSIKRPSPQSFADKKSCFDSLGISYDSKIRFCQLSNPETKPTAAIIGDSHSAKAYSGAAYYLEKNHGVTLVNIAGRLFGNVIAAPKNNSFELGVSLGGFEVAQYIEEHPTIHTIIMVSRGFWYLDWADEFYIPGRNLESKEEVFLYGIRDLFERFSDRRIIFVLEVPALNFDPRQCLDRYIPSLLLSHPKNHQRDDCSVSRARDLEQNQRYFQQISEIVKDYPNVHLIDPRDSICDQTRCYAQVSGRVIYADDNHLNKNGSFILGKQISDVLTNQLTKNKR